MEYIVLFDNSKTDEHAWKEARKQHLTGTDIAKIMQYLVDGENSYYGEHITKFTYFKFNATDKNKFMNDKCKLGTLYEEVIHAEAVKTYDDPDKYVVHKNRAIKKDCFMVTLDIEVLDKTTNHTTLVECKLTTSENIFQLAKEGRHPLYWQCALQLFVCDFTDIVHFTLKLAESDKEYVSYITRDSYHYKKLLEYIPRLQEIHKIVMEGKEPFFEQVKDKAFFKEICSQIAELRIKRDEVDDAIKPLKELRDKLESELNMVKGIMLDNFKDSVHLQSYDYNGSNFTLQKRASKEYLEDFKNTIENIKETLKQAQKIQIVQAEHKYMLENNRPCYTIEDTLVILRK